MSMFEYSKYDLERNVKLPNLSNDLAEFFGILFGDGSILDTKRIHRTGISLNLTEDFIYKNYVVQLMLKLFRIKPKVRERESEGKFDIEVNSKAISKFLLYRGFPKGKKNNKLIIPNWILENKKFLQKFLKGLIDTDGSLFFAKRGTYKLNMYPVIEIKIIDERFIEQLHQTIKALGFKCNKSKFKVQLNGKENLIKWLEKIGFGNFNLQSRYLIWKKFNYCPPNTNLEQRIKMLS